MHDTESLAGPRINLYSFETRVDLVQQRLESRIEEDRWAEFFGPGSGEIFLESESSEQADDGANLEATSDINPFYINVPELSDIDDEKLQQAYGEVQRSLEDITLPKSQ